MGQVLRLKNATQAYQDGAEFYESESGKLIVSYGKLVKNDHDMQGAIKAFEKFREEFPQYAFEGEDELEAV